jgi:hypothetical protein
MGRLHIEWCPPKKAGAASGHPEARAGLGRTISVSAPQTTPLPRRHCPLRRTSRAKKCKREPPRFRIARIETTRRRRRAKNRHSPTKQLILSTVACSAGVCEERVLASCMLGNRNQRGEGKSKAEWGVGGWKSGACGAQVRRSEVKAQAPRLRS